MPSRNPHQRSGKPKPHNVILRVYDISRGQAEKWSKFFLGTSISGIWHTGVCVFGFEYFYGGGIEKMPPDDVERYYEMHPVKEIRLGTTTKDIFAFEKFLWSVDSSFSRSTYDLLKWNCNNFSDCAARFLMGRGIPQHILKLPESILETRMGPILVDMFKLTRGINPISSPTDDPLHPVHALSRPDGRGRRGSVRARSRSTSVRERRTFSDLMNGMNEASSTATIVNRIGTASTTMESRSVDNFSCDIPSLVTQNQRRSTFNNFGSYDGINSFRSPGMWLNPARAETLQPSFTTLNPVNNRDFPALPFFRTPARAAVSQQSSNDNYFGPPSAAMDAPVPILSQHSSAASEHSVYARMQTPMGSHANGGSQLTSFGLHRERNWPTRVGSVTRVNVASYSAQHNDLHPLHSNIRQNPDYVPLPLTSNGNSSLVSSGIIQNVPVPSNAQGIPEYAMSLPSPPYFQQYLDKLSMDEMSPRSTRHKGNVSFGAVLNNAASVDPMERESPSLETSLSEHLTNRVRAVRNEGSAVSYNGTTESEFYPITRQQNADESMVPRRFESVKESALVAMLGSNPYHSTVKLGTRSAVMPLGGTTAASFPSVVSDPTVPPTDWCTAPKVQLRTDLDNSRGSLSNKVKDLTVEYSSAQPAPRKQPVTQLCSDANLVSQYCLYRGPVNDLPLFDRLAVGKSRARSLSRTKDKNAPSRMAISAQQSLNFENLDKMSALSTSAGKTSIYSRGVFANNSASLHRPREPEESSRSTIESDTYTAELISDTESTVSRKMSCDSDSSRNSVAPSINTTASDFNFEIADSNTVSICLTKDRKYCANVESEPTVAVVCSDHDGSIVADTGRKFHSTLSTVGDRDMYCMTSMIGDPEVAGDMHRMRKSESLSAINLLKRAQRKNRESKKVVAPKGTNVTDDPYHRVMSSQHNNDNASSTVFENRASINTGSVSASTAATAERQKLTRKTLHKQQNVMVLHWDNLHFVEKAGKRKLQSVDNSSPVDRTTSQSTKSKLHKPEIRSEHGSRAAKRMTRPESPNNTVKGIAASEQDMDSRIVLMRPALSSKNTSRRIATPNPVRVDAFQKVQEAISSQQLQQRMEPKRTPINSKAVDRDHAGNNRTSMENPHEHNSVPLEGASIEFLPTGGSLDEQHDHRHSTVAGAAYKDYDSPAASHLHTIGGRVFDDNSSRRSTKGKAHTDRKGQQQGTTRRSRQHRLVPLWSSRDGTEGNNMHSSNIENHCTVVIPSFGDSERTRPTVTQRSETPAVRKSAPLSTATPRVYGGPWRSSRQNGEVPREPLVKVNTAVARAEILKARKVTSIAPEANYGGRHRTVSTTTSALSTSSSSDYQQGNQWKGELEASLNDCGVVDAQRRTPDSEDRSRRPTQDGPSLVKSLSSSVEIQKRRVAVTSEMLGAAGSSSVAAEIQKNMCPQKLVQQRTDSRQVRLRHVHNLRDGSAPEDQIMTKPMSKFAYDSRGNKKKMQQRDYKFAPVSFRIVDRLPDQMAV